MGYYGQSGSGEGMPGDPLPIAHGGTGAVSAADARSSLGAANASSLADHMADAALHRPVDDQAIAADSLWSSQKVSDELDERTPQGTSTVLDVVVNASWDGLTLRQTKRSLTFVDGVLTEAGSEFEEVILTGQEGCGS